MSTPRRLDAVARGSGLLAHRWDQRPIVILCLCWRTCWFEAPVEREGAGGSDVDAGVGLGVIVDVDVMPDMDFSA